MQILSGPRPLGALIALVAAVLIGLGGAPPRETRARVIRHSLRASGGAPQTGPFAVGIRAITFVDRSRTIRFPGHTPQPRSLTTVIRYPALGSAAGVDLPGAAPARTAGPFPLVIFGHGFAVTPAPYARLLEAWASAGYVVAAPIFPLGNAHAPGGPNESDILNQPRDMSFVISQMLALSAKPGGGLFSQLIAPGEIAVSGQSDGAETALLTAYNTQFIDRRVGAAVILSGAEIPGIGGYSFPAPSPPLLAAQGTADPLNPAHFTYAFYNQAPRPKFLLTLPGASHLPPYTTEEPQLSFVERVTIDFLNRFLKRTPGALPAMRSAGNVRGVAALRAQP